jgi:hypothetical protein
MHRPREDNPEKYSASGVPFWLPTSSDRFTERVLRITTPFVFCGPNKYLHYPRLQRQFRQDVFKQIAPRCPPDPWSEM